MDSKIEIPFFSVAIPTWEIKGKGVEYLEHSFNILAQQSFTDFEVVVSDHSQDDEIKDLCEAWNSQMNINYFKNPHGRGRIAPNINNAIENSRGLFIKMLFQDDFLYDIDSLQIIYDSIAENQDKDWFITACVHTDDCITMYDRMTPYYHDRIYAGVNTISCPSVLTIRNEYTKPKFDESLNWLVDVDYYKRLHMIYGNPVVIDTVCAVNRNAEVRATNMTTEKQKQSELQRVIRRYETR
jgi:glycosyltransferase involved in cell wall biosynthesis